MIYNRIKLAKMCDVCTRPFLCLKLNNSNLNRGNKYSDSHTKWSPSQSEFWNWTFDQMAKRDLPAILRYIKSVTNKKVHYIGRSIICNFGGGL